MLEREFFIPLETGIGETVEVESPTKLEEETVEGVETGPACAKTVRCGIEAWKLEVGRGLTGTETFRSEGNPIGTEDETSVGEVEVISAEGK